MVKKQSRQTKKEKEFFGDREKGFISLPYEIFDSWAWSQLNKTRRALYLIMRRTQSYPEYKYTKFNFTYSYYRDYLNRFSVEGVKKTPSETTFYNSIDDLIEYGFIVRNKLGGIFSIDGVEHKVSSIYSFSGNWRRLSDGKKSFMRFSKKRA